MTTSTVDVASLLPIALAAAGQAEALLAHRPEGLAVAATKSSPTDVVTEMDRASERLIVSVLREARPDDGILGEEGAATTGSSGVRWVVDPIDGTVNYLYGLPGWAVSIAAQVAGQTVVGVVTVPSQGEVFSAVRGGGAFLNGRRLRANTGVALDRALIATGFGYAEARRVGQARVVAGLLPRVRDIRRFGSAAVDLCAVAAGRVDAYYERGPQEWDVAAGALIAAEAGARVEGLRGAPASPELTIAAGTGLFAELHDLLAALDADRD